jgi:hypothetical protein
LIVENLQRKNFHGKFARLHVSESIIKTKINIITDIDNQQVVAYNVSVMLFKSSPAQTFASGKMSGVTKLLMRTNKALKSTGIAISRTV